MDLAERFFKQLDASMGSVAAVCPDDSDDYWSARQELQHELVKATYP